MKKDRTIKEIIEDIRNNPDAMKQVDKLIDEAEE